MYLITTPFIRSFRAELRAFCFRPVHRPTFGQVVSGLLILGATGIGFLSGAAVLYFQLPSSDYLRKAFQGVQAWLERRHQPAPAAAALLGRPARVVVDKPGKTYDGFSLFTTANESQATLYDMGGQIVYQWRLPFSQVWSQAPHIRNQISDERIHWFRCHLYPNGDVLAVYHAAGDTPYGYGLAKINKDSQLLWGYAGRVHHDVDVGEDGTIYTLTQEFIHKTPAGLDYLPTPYLADTLVVLSADGKELQRVPILEALRDSPYAALLMSAVREGRPSVLPQRQQQVDLALFQGHGDILHTNSVKVLSRALAPRFPLFRAGQVLISIRNLDALAAVNLQTGSVVWAACGSWRHQHDAEFLDNGRLLLFDNAGSPLGSRVLEYDPVSQAMPWVYENEAFNPFRGMKQRLPNGNTLILDPDLGCLIEVSRDKEVVWEGYTPCNPVNGMQRYGAHELSFLKGDIHARP